MHNNGYTGIYRAIWNTTNLQVVIKIQKRNDPKTQWQITTERQAIGTLSKQCSSLKIQQLVAYGTPENEDGFIAMVTLYAGPNILDISADGILPENKIVSICLEVLDTLRAIYEKDWTHRDIKPENIACDNGRITLIDFGCAEYLKDRHGNRITTGQDKSGTLPYMSVRVHRGEVCRLYDDCFSLFLMMLRLRLGSLPWEQDPKTTEKKMLDMKLNLIQNGLQSDWPISGYMRVMFDGWLEHFKQVEKADTDVDASRLIRFMQDASKKLK